MNYALYKGDAYIVGGTLKEIEEHTGKSRRNLQSILSRTKRDGLMYRKHNQLMLVPEGGVDIKEDIEYHLHNIRYHIEKALELDSFRGGANDELENIKKTTEDALRKLKQR